MTTLTIALPTRTDSPAGNQSHQPLMKKAISLPAMIGICVAGACAFLNLQATQPLLPFFVQYFHCSKAAASLTVSATALAVAFSAPVIGVLADRIGRKIIVVPAIFLLAIPTALAATSPDIHTLTIWRFVQGLILPAIFAVTMAYITEEWEGKDVGSAMATYVAGNVVGGFTGRSIAGLTAEYCDWRVAFITLALTTVAGGFLAWWLLPAAKRKTKTKQDGFMWSAITTHLKNPSLLITFAIGSMILFSIIAAFTYINYRLAAPPYNFSSGSLSYLFSVYLVGAFVTPFSGKMIDRLGFRKAFTIAGALSLIGLLATLSTSIVIIALGLAVFCSCIFICQSSTTSSLGQLAPGQRSTAAGLYVFFYYLGGSLGGYLPGLVYDFGGWTSCVALIAVVQISALSIAWFFWKARESKSKLQEMQAYS